MIPMNDLFTIGEIIRQIRKSGTHKTQEAFAELIDTTPETVSNIERGLVFLNTQTLVSISEKCSVSSDYILGSNTENNILSQLSQELLEEWEQLLTKDGITKSDFINNAIVCKYNISVWNGT